MESVPPPPPSLNGGLYTGEPFRKGAPYANIPVTPDADFLIHHNLRSADPPGPALTQYPGGLRPGNNFQEMPGVRPAGAPWYVAKCARVTRMSGLPPQPEACPCYNCTGKRPRHV
jgi:hypothetical protein